MVPIMSEFGSVAVQRAEALLANLGGDEAVDFIATKTIEFLNADEAHRAEMRDQVSTHACLNELAKDYLRARYDDLQPIAD